MAITQILLAGQEIAIYGGGVNLPTEIIGKLKVTNYCTLPNASALALHWL